MKKIIVCMSVFAAFLLISCATSLSNMAGSESEAGYGDLLNALSIQSGICKSGNCINGTGTYETEKGLNFTGAFSKGKPNGEGTLSYGGLKYTLVYKNGKPADGPVKVCTSEGAVIKTLYIRNGKLSSN